MINIESVLGKEKTEAQGEENVPLEDSIQKVKCFNFNLNLNLNRSGISSLDF
jgi:hypothetical protein